VFGVCLLSAGLFLKSGNNPKSLAFPDSVDNVPGSVQGLPPWVTSTRARDIAKLLLLPKDVPAALRAIEAASVRGLPPEVRAVLRGLQIASSSPLLPLLSYVL
jgi:hypothetical protein